MDNISAEKTIQDSKTAPKKNIKCQFIPKKLSMESLIR